MKRILISAVLGVFLLLNGYMGYSQAAEIQQLALNIEKLSQFRKILRNMYDAYAIIKGGYDKVKNITSGNYSIHQAFLDGLMAVSPGVRNYKKIPEIIRNQAYILSEYRSAFNQFKASGIFSTAEISYFSKIYDNLLERSVSNINELTMVLTAGQTRMSDDERLTAIDRLAAEIEEQLGFLRSFNSRTAVFAQQRLREKNDIETLRKLRNIDKP